MKIKTPRIKRIARILAGLATAGIIAGVIGSQKPDLLSYEEATALIDIYNSGIQQTGEVSLLEVNQDNLITKLNKEISKRIDIEREVEIRGKKIKIKKLMEKAEQKSLIEKIID